MARSDRGWSPAQADLDWIEATSRPLHPVLAEMEAAAEPEQIPILSRDSGRMLAVLAASRRRVVEVGTAIGYSTLWMGLALPPGGTIVTIDPDQERTDRARAFWRSAGLPDSRISVVNAPALESFAGERAELAGPFDMVFIDALKDEYLAYLGALMDRLEPGALVVADNVLWSGRTSGSRSSRAGDGTEALREFCARVGADPAFETTILPIGDGLLVATLRP
ncbi:MAG TPA: O-methyltransferase [Candidatus Limnocylindria bacterium]|nr:O-methyltransferase [Candidatus Limnocylindria bacterium]